jgi:8-amino-7-oxononanoate synthase
VLDFTSSLYLGIAHPSSRLPGWASLTRGTPAALNEPPAAREITSRVAQMLETPAARLASSTLHAFVDLGATLSAAHGRMGVAADVASYPIGRLGLSSCLCGPGKRIRRVAHHSVPAAQQWAEREDRFGRVPVLLVDGWCPGCGRVAPVVGLNEVLREHGGLLIVDDTQGVGILGAAPRSGNPWGHGGGGSVVHSGSPDGVLVVASLAKAFGAPLAVLAGPTELVASTWDLGPTVAHSSPPPVPVGLAARRALDINDCVGEQLRASLRERLERLQHGLLRRKVPIDSGRFPVVRVPAPDRNAAARAVRALAGDGIRAVALGPSCQGRPALGLVVNATLREDDIDRAVIAVATALRSAA